MHPSDEMLQALADGELSLVREAEVRRHLAECSACERRLLDWKDMESHVAALLRPLDHPVPAVSVDALIARAAAGIRTRRRAAVAAGIATLVVAGVAAAAAPGSPVRHYVERVLATAPFARPRQAPIAHQRGIRTSQADANGLAFTPTTGIDVTFRSSQVAGIIRITLSDSLAVRIAQRGGSAGYALTDGGVAVQNEGSTASYDLTLPRTVPYAAVRIGQRIVFATAHERITTAAPRDTSGSYVIRFTEVNRGRTP